LAVDQRLAMGTTFYIHIGVPKTGTTSIQHTLFDNRAKLLSEGINYLALARNHAGALMPLVVDEPHKHRRYLRRSIDTSEKARSRNEATRLRLEHELTTNRCQKVLISGEAFSAASPDEVLRLKGLLDPYAERYRIIVYVRDPYEYANSAALQRVKGGATLDDCANGVVLPRYTRLATYIRLFGRENVDIRIFDPKRFVDRDLIADFFVALGEPPELRHGIRIVNANKSLSHEAAMIMSEINIAVPVQIGGYANPQRANNVRFLMEAIDGVKYACDPQAYMKQQKSVLADMQWLREQVGEPVFASSAPRPASVPQWSDETVRSIQALVRNMTVAARRLNGGRNATGLNKLAPDNLRWLQPALDLQQPALPPAPSVRFDQETIRSLASFIHEIAFRTEQMHADERKVPPPKSNLFFAGLTQMRRWMSLSRRAG
jgi:hypothetical protein